MNNQKVLEIIKRYKENFEHIHLKEIYKWRSVKCFRDNWDIKASDFSTMLDKSFALAKNLLSSGQYFPKRMLHHYALKEPESLRKLFYDLYQEDKDLISRIKNFQIGIKAINKKYFDDKNDYHDIRAILVYLSLRYPNRYFLYKFEMFKEFVKLIDYPYEPKQGAIQNILEYLSLCRIINAEIIKDSELLKLHMSRIGEKEYVDSSYHLLTQDIIYAAVQHKAKFDTGVKLLPASKRLILINWPISPISEKIALRGSFTNYIENEIANKRIGDLGELLVLQYERDKLKSHGISKNPIHKSKSEGDGLGYDILSFDENGKEIFIEVKTTITGVATPFFITQNELERSKQDFKKFFLYRLFEFDDKANTAKYYIRKGMLTDLCSNPILYKAKLEK